MEVEENLTWSSRVCYAFIVS